MGKKKGRRQKRNRLERRPIRSQSIILNIKRNWPLLKTYFLFGITILILFTITMIKPVYLKVIVPFNEILASSSGWLIENTGGGQIIVDETSVVGSRFSINIAEGCNGIYALSVVIAGIVAFPVRWKPKMVGLLLAVALIMGLNYVRIITLWYAGIYSSFVFDTMHLYIWEFVIIALGAVFWYFWYEKFVKAD